MNSQLGKKLQPTALAQDNPMAASNHIEWIHLDRFD
jgi:hypothetical protein